MGYSKEIFNETQQTNLLQCIVCSDIAQQPVQCIHCDTLFCEKCLEDYQKMNQTCPYCKQGDLQVREINRILKNIMSSLQVHCRNEGCNQELNLEKLDQHESICLFHKVYCKNFGCKKSTYRKDAEIHEVFCQYKLVDCSHWQQTFRQSEFVKHSCIQILKQQLFGFQEAIERQEKKLDVINQLRQFVQTQNEKIQQLESDKHEIHELLSETQINYQYALTQIGKNSIELEAYKKETSDQNREISIQLSELTNAVMQIQKLQSEQNSFLKKQQDTESVIEISKVEYHDKKVKHKKQKKSIDNSHEEQKDDKLMSQINISLAEQESEERDSLPDKKPAYIKQSSQLTTPDRQRNQDYQEENSQLKEHQYQKYTKQKVNQKQIPTVQQRNQDLEKPIQLKKEIQEAVNKALQNIKKPASSSIPQQDQQLQEQSELSQQISQNQNSPRKPLLFIDVNMSPRRKDRIIVYPGDTPEELANIFSQKHNRYSKDQLVIMIRSQMKDV